MSAIQTVCMIPLFDIYWPNLYWRMDNPSGQIWRSIFSSSEKETSCINTTMHQYTIASTSFFCLLNLKGLVASHRCRYSSSAQLVRGFLAPISAQTNYQNELEILAQVRPDGFWVIVYTPAQSQRISLHLATTEIRILFSQLDNIAHSHLHTVM